MTTSMLSFFVGVLVGVLLGIAFSIVSLTTVILRYFARAGRDQQRAIETPSRTEPSTPTASRVILNGERLH